MNNHCAKPRKESVKTSQKLRKTNPEKAPGNKILTAKRSDTPTKTQVQPRVVSRKSTPSKRSAIKAKQTSCNESKTSIPTSIEVNENGGMSSKKNIQRKKESVKKREAKKKEKCSSLPPSTRRRNACSQAPFYLQTAKTSPGNLSPVSSPECRPHRQVRRLAFFEEKKEVQSRGENGRRDAVCNGTDRCAEERIAVRVIFKKF